MRPPVTPQYPFVWLTCTCGLQTNSLSAVCGEEPFTYVCFYHQTDAEREAVRLATNVATEEASKSNPSWVATARRQLGLKRPRRVLMDSSWEGCGVQDDR